MFSFKRYNPCKTFFFKLVQIQAVPGLFGYLYWFSDVTEIVRKIQTRERCIGCLQYGQHSVFLTDWNFLITTTQKYFSLPLPSWENSNYSTNLQIFYISWVEFKLKHYRYDVSRSFTRAGEIRWKGELHGKINRQVPFPTEKSICMIN